jgi:hypothetical protein
MSHALIPLILVLAIIALIALIWIGRMSHAWRPLILVLAIVAFILIARLVLVPSDFQSANGDYKYQWHRLGSEDDWKNMKVKHQGRDFCKQCHSDKIEIVTDSGHAKVQCENCHVLFEVEAERKGHPLDLKDPSTYKNFGIKPVDYDLEIGINSKRKLCMRCHTNLVYRPKIYKGLEKDRPFKLIDPENHNPGHECVECHDVHRTGFKCDRCHVKSPDKKPVFIDAVIPEYNADLHKQFNPDNLACTNCHDGHKSGFKFKKTQTEQKTMQPTEQPVGQTQQGTEQKKEETAQ